jgi:hypothetical protein
MLLAKVTRYAVMCVVFLSGLLLSVRLSGQQGQPRQQAAQRNANRCDAPEYHQMDFVLGSWEASNKDKKIADVTIERTSTSSCGLMEAWRSVRGGGGNGLFAYSPAGKGWQYMWVPSSGRPEWLDGGKPTANQNEIEFNETQTAADGTSHQSHWTLTKMPDGRIREFEVSVPDGKTISELYWTKK